MPSTGRSSSCRGVHPEDREAGAVGGRHHGCRLRRPQRRGAQAADRCPVAGRVGAAEGGQDHGVGMRAEGFGEDPVERGGGGVGEALVLEQEGDGGLRVDGQGVAPAQLVERGVEVVAGVRGGGVAQAPVEELAVLGVHHRSLPRSRRRLAMMLRWISALPP